MHDVLVVVQGMEDAVVLYGEPNAVQPPHAEYMLAQTLCGSRIGAKRNRHTLNFSPRDRSEVHNS